MESSPIPSRTSPPAGCRSAAWPGVLGSSASGRVTRVADPAARVLGRCRRALRAILGPAISERNLDSSVRLLDKRGQRGSRGRARTRWVGGRFRGEAGRFHCGSLGAPVSTARKCASPVLQSGFETVPVSLLTTSCGSARSHPAAVDLGTPISVATRMSPELWTSCRSRWS